MVTNYQIDKTSKKYSFFDFDMIIHFNMNIGFNL